MKKNFKNNFYNNILFIILIFCISLFLLIFMESESDYFWHIKTGEYIFNNGILKNDVFSWTAIGKSWMSHEWLFELFIFLLKMFFSKYHLMVYGFIFIFTLHITIYLCNKRDFLKNIPFSLTWLAFSIVFMSSMQGRPNLISFNFLSITIMLLFDNYKNVNSKKIYLLPFISILWSNIHGGSSNLVYLFCLIFYICSLFNFNFSKIISKKISKTQRFRFIITFFLCILATCINVHGIKMLAYPYQNMLDSTMLNVIHEWHPINLNLLNHYPYIILVAFIFFVLLFSKKKIQFIDLILFLFSVFLGFKSIRFCCYTYIIMSYIVFYYIEPRREDKGTKLLLILCSIIFFSIFIFNFKSIVYNVNNKFLSNKMINIIKQEKTERLFNEYDLGGELLYNDIYVFIDGRADLYSKINLKDYLIISNTSSGFIELINKYNFDYYLVNKNSNINYYLNNNKSYELIYFENNYLLYKKN